MAAALASQSQLLISDEPTNHIDSSMVNGWKIILPVTRELCYGHP